MQRHHNVVHRQQRPHPLRVLGVDGLGIEVVEDRLDRDERVVVGGAVVVPGVEVGPGRGQQPDGVRLVPRRRGRRQVRSVRPDP